MSNSSEKSNLDSKLLKKFNELFNALDDYHIKNWNRSVPFGDNFVNRWDRAVKLGFGENSNLYSNSLIIGDINVGNEVWIGPNTILDGSGGLTIGDYCTIAAGVGIYSHDNVRSTLSSKKSPIEREPVEIKNNTYIGPNSIISKGVTIGKFSIVGVNSYVNKSFPDYSIIAGNPAKQIGEVEINELEIQFKYI